MVCNPRRNALLKEGSKDDRVDARKLSELLCAGLLRAVYHGENGLRTLRELARSYEVVSKDLMRAMNRIKASVSQLGDSLHGHAGLRPAPSGAVAATYSRGRGTPPRRAVLSGIGRMQTLRRTVRGELLSREPEACGRETLRQIPFIGPLQAAHA